MTASTTFEEVYAQYFQSTVDYVKGRFRVSLQDAEDVVEAVFIRLWRLNPEMEGIDSPAAAIRYRAKLMAMKYLVRQHPTLSLDMPIHADSDLAMVEAQDLQPFAPTLEDQVLAEMELGRVSLEVEQWPVVKQVILKMSVAGYSYEEISQYVTRRYGFQGTDRAVSKLLVKMRKQLRQAFQVQKVLRRGVQLSSKGTWSERYTACVGCGTNERRHRANGLCTRCYEVKRFREGKRKAKVPRSAMQWAREYTACVKCGTTTESHEAKGLCKTCYRRHYMASPLRAPRRVVAVYR